MTEGMNTEGVEAYLRRLGVEQPAWRPTVNALRELRPRIRFA